MNLHNIQYIQSRKLEASGLQGIIAPTNLPASRPSLMTQWIDKIEGRGGAPDTNVDDGVNLTELLEGIYKSAETGKAHAF